MKKNGFTLTETMIVLIILGVISMIVLPPVIRKYQEAVNRAKIKKAMSAYDTAISKMVIENELKTLSALNAWANGNNCENSSQYFKKIDGDGCIFKTSDGVWWNIEDISRAIVAFKEINNDNRGTISTAAKNPDDNSAFVLVTSFDDNGSTRVDDLSYETNHPTFRSNVLVGKLYDFINNSGKVCDILCKYKRGDFTTPCESGTPKESCTVTTYNSSGVGTAKIYNAEGKQVGTVTINAQGVTTNEVITNDDGSKTTISYRADGTKSQETIEKYDSTGKNGTRADIIYYADGVTVKSEGSQQKIDGLWGCGTLNEYREDGSLSKLTEILDSSKWNRTTPAGFSNSFHGKSTLYDSNGNITSIVTNYLNTGDNKEEYPNTYTSMPYNSSGILTSTTQIDYARDWTDARGGGEITTTSYGYGDGETVSQEIKTTQINSGTLVADALTRTDYYQNGQPKAVSTLVRTQGMFGSYHTTDLYNSSGQKVATVSLTKADESLPYSINQNYKHEIVWYDSSGNIVTKDVTEYAADTIKEEFYVEEGKVYLTSRGTVTNPNPISTTNYRITYDSSGNEIIDNNPRKVASSIIHYTLGCGYGAAQSKVNKNYDFGMMPSW